MKKSITFIVSVAFLFIISSCSSGYVDSEPTYVEVARPSSPGPNYVWINGDWQWRNNTYQHQNGYWDKPRNGKKYTQGHWEKGKRGNHWNNGRWE